MHVLQKKEWCNVKEQVDSNIWTSSLCGCQEREKESNIVVLKVILLGNCSRLLAHLCTEPELLRHLMRMGNTGRSHPEDEVENGHWYRVYDPYDHMFLLIESRGRQAASS